MKRGRNSWGRDCRHPQRGCVDLKRLIASFSLVLLFVACQPSGVGHSAYYPGAGDDWERRAPEQVGMDPAALQEAIEFAIANENPAPHDLAIALSQSR